MRGGGKDERRSDGGLVEEIGVAREGGGGCVRVDWGENKEKKGNSGRTYKGLSRTEQGTIEKNIGGK